MSMVPEWFLDPFGDRPPFGGSRGIRDPLFSADEKTGGRDAYRLLAS